MSNRFSIAERACVYTGRMHHGKSVSSLKIYTPVRNMMTPYKYYKQARTPYRIHWIFDKKRSRCSVFSEKNDIHCRGN